MKIIVASTIVPFIYGGGTSIVDWLVLKLNEYGHQAESIKLPYSSDIKQMMSQTVGLRMFHLEDYCERLIPIRMPSYQLQHPEKYLWFIHHYREVYDLWDTEFSPFPHTEKNCAIREYVMRSDDVSLREAKKIFTNSQVVSNRLTKFNALDSTVVYPPLFDISSFRCNSYGDYIYYSSRICSHKRQLLAVQAMKYTKTPVKLVITGKSERPQDAEEIYYEIKYNHLEDRVTVIDRWISDEEKAKFLSDCLAAIYIPYDEDSYGYPSLEAHHSQKAVISCKDSGGTDELIVDGYNGYLTDPTPQALASVYDEMYLDKNKTETMGRNGLKRIDELQINWDNVVRRFTE